MCLHEVISCYLFVSKDLGFTVSVHFFGHFIFKSAWKLQLCLWSCLHGTWKACILWLRRDCSGQDHAIRQVVPPTLAWLLRLYRPLLVDDAKSSPTIWVKMLRYEEVFNRALDFLCMEKQFKCSFFFLWSPASLSNKIISMTRITIHHDMRCTLISFLQSPEVMWSQGSWDDQMKTRNTQHLT